MTEFQQIAKIFRSSSEQEKLIRDVKEFLDILEDDIEIQAEQEARGYKESGDEAMFLMTGRSSI